MASYPCQALITGYNSFTCPFFGKRYGICMIYMINMLYILLYIIYLSVLENNGETRLAVFHHTPNNQSWARAERWEYDYKLQCGRRKQIMVIILHQHSIFIKMWSFRATKSFLFKTWIVTTKHLTNLDIRNIKNINLEHFQHFIFSRGLRRWSKKIASKYHQKLKLFEIRKIQRTKSLNGKFRAWGWKWWDISFNPHKNNCK